MRWSVSLDAIEAGSRLGAPGGLEGPVAPHAITWEDTRANSTGLRLCMARALTRGPRERSREKLSQGAPVRACLSESASLASGAESSDSRDHDLRPRHRPPRLRLRARAAT